MPRTRPNRNLVTTAPDRLTAEQIKIGACIVAVDGCGPERYGKAYGRKYGRFGTTMRVKFADFDFEETTSARTLTAAQLRALDTRGIGFYVVVP